MWHPTCFWPPLHLCDGLLRDPNESDRESHSVQNFILPTLHTHRDEFVARKISELIIKYTPDALKGSTSAKRLQIGLNTSLAMHCDITYSCNRCSSHMEDGAQDLGQIYTKKTVHA